MSPELQEILDDTNYSLRTQISLSSTLRGYIEVKRKIYGESLAEYMRKAAILRILTEEKEHDERRKLAQTLTGSISKNKYKDWSSITKIVKWQSKLRSDSPRFLKISQK